MKERTSALLEKAAESLEAARKLLDLGHPGFSTSRSYYAMLYVAEALLFEEGREFAKHSSVHAAFGQFLVKPGRLDAKYHRYLLDAFDERLIGDYDVGHRVSEEAARTLLGHAEEFLSAGREYLEKREG